MSNQTDSFSPAKEYEICERRGHTPDQLKGTTFVGSLGWEVCKWCGVHFAWKTQTELVERFERGEKPDA